jgi:hypothetical protein
MEVTPGMYRGSPLINELQSLREDYEKAVGNNMIEEGRRHAEGRRNLTEGSNFDQAFELEQRDLACCQNIWNLFAVSYCLELATLTENKGDTYENGLAIFFDEEGAI